MLMVGLPGTGKSMIAKRMATILPDMTEEEAIEATKIHSIAGRLSDKSFMVTRPFRAPHHNHFRCRFTRWWDESWTRRSESSAS